MKFNIMGIVFMFVAIWLGQLLGGYLEVFLGSLGGGLAATLIAGFIAYVIYTLLTKGKMNIVQGLIFTVLIYIANLAGSYVAGMIGMAGGMVTLVFAAVVASLLWGWIGGKSRAVKL